MSCRTAHHGRWRASASPPRRPAALIDACAWRSRFASDGAAPPRHAPRFQADATIRRQRRHGDEARHILARASRASSALPPFGLVTYSSPPHGAYHGACQRQHTLASRRGWAAASWSSPPVASRHGDGDGYSSTRIGGVDAGDTRPARLHRHAWWPPPGLLDASPPRHSRLLSMEGKRLAVFLRWRQACYIDDSSMHQDKADIAVYF